MNANGQVAALSSFPENAGVQIGFSRVSDGNMSYRFGSKEEVYGNRSRYFAKEGVPSSRIATFFTEHRDDIHVLEKFPEDLDAIKGERWQVTDAIFTSLPRTAIFLTFADCVPFVLYDRKQHCMAFAHIGWRSMAMNFTSKVIKEFEQRYQSAREDLLVAIGPSIKKESYLFANPVQAKQAIWHPFLHPGTKGRLGIDLPGFCLQECQEAGLSQSQIYLSRMDTAQDPDQFSHYAGTEGGRPEKQGRFLFYAFLKEG